MHCATGRCYRLSGKIDCVSICVGRNDKKLDVVSEECDCLIINRNHSTIASAVTCDLSDVEAAKDLSQEITNVSISPVDAFVHATGVSSWSRFINTNISVDKLLMNVNFLSGAVLSKMVVPGMIKQKFGIVAWISGVQGFGKKAFDFVIAV